MEIMCKVMLVFCAFLLGLGFDGLARKHRRKKLEKRLREDTENVYRGLAYMAYLAGSRKQRDIAERN